MLTIMRVANHCRSWISLHNQHIHREKNSYRFVENAEHSDLYHVLLLFSFASRFWPFSPDSTPLSPLTGETRLCSTSSVGLELSDDVGSILFNQEMQWGMLVAFGTGGKYFVSSSESDFLGTSEVVLPSPMLLSMDPTLRQDALKLKSFQVEVEWIIPISTPCVHTF